MASMLLALFVSIVFVSAMFFSAASGSFIHRYGGIRANQLGMTLSACCLLLALGGSLPWLYLAAALVGLGYGPNTPSGSHVLARVTPLDLRDGVFGPGDTARSDLAHMAASVTRIGPEAFRIMVFRSCARSFVHEMRSAMEGVAARVRL